MSVPINSTSRAGFLRSEPLLTVDQLKSRYLFGIDLTDEDGNEIPRDTLQHYIDSAVSYLEHKMDIIIQDTTFVERHDYNQNDYTHFALLQLKHRPLLKLNSWKAKFPNNSELVNYPEEWFVEEKESAQVQLVPVEGSFSGLIVTQGGSYVPLIYSTRSSWAHLFELEYRAGFEHDKMPIIINEMIGMQAAIRAFEVLGDIVIGQGIAGESVSLDGATVSRNTTASAQFSAFSARIESYKKQMTEYIKTVKQHYNGVNSLIV